MDGFQEMLGLPVEQCNAPYEGDGFIMRVGVPDRGGALPAHAFNEGFPAMVSANAFWDSAKSCFKVPRATPLTDVDFALDSAGFTAISTWKRKGTQAGMAGVYPWTLAQYITLASEMSPAWWAAPDLCCEREVAADASTVDYRVRATATLLEGTLRQLWAWQNELARDCSARTVADMLPPPVPVLQGWQPDDYLRSLELTLAVWERWQPWVAAPRLIGVGSMCRRKVDGPEGLLAVLGVLEGRLPPGTRLHLFGVKGAALREIRTRPWIASADSMAYDVGARRKAFREGVPNSVGKRAAAMTDWMGRAAEQARPAAGDQARLALEFA